MPVVGSTRVTPSFEDGGPGLVDCLDVILGKDDSEVGIAEGSNANQVVNDGMMWPWWADGGRFMSLSWALAEERAMVPSAVPTRMLGAEVLQWLTGALLGEVNLAHQDQQWTDGLELPEFQAELEQPEEQNK
jgi:hypothetical protein